MTINRNPLVSRLGFLTMLCLFGHSPGHTSEHDASINLRDRIAGPVSVTDLRVLLDNEQYFQMFDFETDDDFCLFFTHEHNHDNRLVHTTSGNRICHLAGRHRLIVTMHRRDDARLLRIGVHDLDNGMGSTGVSLLTIPTTYLGWSSFPGEGTLHAGREVTVVRWVFVVGQPGTSSRSEHELRIKVRLDDNPESEVSSLWRQ